MTGGDERSMIMLLEKHLENRRKRLLEHIETIHKTKEKAGNETV